MADMSHCWGQPVPWVRTNLQTGPRLTRPPRCRYSGQPETVRRQASVARCSVPELRRPGRRELAAQGGQLQPGAVSEPQVHVHLARRKRAGPRTVGREGKHTGCERPGHWLFRGLGSGSRSSRTKLGTRRDCSRWRDCERGYRRRDNWAQQHRHWAVAEAGPDTTSSPGDLGTGT